MTSLVLSVKGGGKLAVTGTAFLGATYILEVEGSDKMAELPVLTLLGCRGGVLAQSVVVEPDAGDAYIEIALDTKELAAEWGACKSGVVVVDGWLTLEGETIARGGVRVQWAPWVASATGTPINLTGPAGPQGPQGPAGEKGETGETGPAGAKGEKGEKGDQGPAGPMGATGATGPQGPVGATGPTGAQGVQGETGPQGATGATGPQGPAGPTGSQGPQGPIGAQGIQGPAGPAGEKGATGATGPVGPAGPQGEPGRGLEAGVVALIEELPMFNPLTARDMEMRQQVERLTEILRAVVA